MKIPFLNRNKSIKLKVAFASDVGLKRANNEDNGSAVSGKESPEGTQGILIVADGMGGHDAGEVASAIAVESLLRQLSTLSQDTTMPQGGYSEILGNMLQKANSEIREAGRESGNHNMGTTCTIALLSGNSLNIAHIGDSRGYLLREGNLNQLTSDHSLVAEMVEAGGLTPEEAENHPRRNVITRALGIEDTIEGEISSVELMKNDLILLCSDGLHGLVNDVEITSILNESNIDKACDLLINKALEMGGNDNVTVAIGKVV